MISKVSACNFLGEVYCNLHVAMILNPFLLCCSWRLSAAVSSQINLKECLRSTNMFIRILSHKKFYTRENYLRVRKNFIFVYRITGTHHPCKTLMLHHHCYFFHWIMVNGNGDNFSWWHITGYWTIKGDKRVLQTIISGKNKTPIWDWDECSCINDGVSILGWSVFTLSIFVIFVGIFNSYPVVCNPGIGPHIHPWMWGFHMSWMSIRWDISLLVTSFHYQTLACLITNV